MDNSGMPLITGFLDLAVLHNASDLHLVSGHAPICRIQGELVRLDLPVNETDYLKKVIFEILTDEQKSFLEENSELDFSHFSRQGNYFRVNVHRERGKFAATIRVMPGSLRCMQDLGLPAIVGELALRRSGLILAVGRAGSGKTTTLAHMVEHINENRAHKIITIEDPIEYVHQSKRSLIVQREIGVDTPSFASGLKYALRQDPDVVVVGEMRDLDSISMALSTAETGHLVMGTLHSPDAVEAVNRIIDVYPGDKQNQIRLQLAENLLAVIGQQLIPHKTKDIRVLATEVLVATMPVRNLIRRNAFAEIRSQMETGREGMYTAEQYLSRLVHDGIISPEVAQIHAKHPSFLQL